MNTTEVLYFRFPVRAPAHLHGRLSGLQHVVEAEIATTLRCMSAACMSTPEREEILVYLHYMYFYRFALPAVEACFPTESGRFDPALVRFQLLCCLLGRFLDDTVDRDSGFWPVEEASFWVDEFARRCEASREAVGLGADAAAAWRRNLEIASTPPSSLYRRVGTGAGIGIATTCPLPVVDYPNRVPYFFWLPRWRGTWPEGCRWLESYIQALFYWYDIDDVLNDIMHNVATAPAYDLLCATLDSEGRMKVLDGRAVRALADMEARGLTMLERCAESGRSLGLLLGPAMLDREIDDFKSPHPPKGPA